MHPVFLRTVRPGTSGSGDTMMVLAGWARDMSLMLLGAYAVAAVEMPGGKMSGRGSGERGEEWEQHKREKEREGMKGIRNVQTIKSGESVILSVNR